MNKKKQKEKKEQNKYHPARNMLEVIQVLDFNEPLEGGDPKYVRTEKGRGEFSFKNLLSDLGVDVENEILSAPLDKSYNLFCGHNGCGKSTELLQLSDYLGERNIFFVLYLDCVKELDHNNLNYPDIMVAIAKRLLQELQESNIKIKQIYIQELNEWFSEKILKSEKLRDFALEIEAGMGAQASIPWLAKLFAKLTGKIKTGATYKEEIRREVRNSFSDFAASFNQLIKASESELKKKGKARKLLLIIDGTDKLRDDDSQRLFIRDVDQLMQIQANFIYCAPIQLLYEGYEVQQKFDHYTLPMIKIYHKNSSEKYQPGFEVMKKMIYKRIDKSLFEDESVAEQLIEFSGGNPRLLLRLLKYARRASDMKQFRQKDVDKAIYDLKMDYWKFIEPEDYEILYKVDKGEIVGGSSEQIRRLLLNLAILEYNSGWRRSQPVIRSLKEYKKVADAAGN